MSLASIVHALETFPWVDIFLGTFIAGVIIVILSLISTISALTESEHEFEHEVDHDVDHDIDHEIEHEFEHEFDHDVDHDLHFDVEHDVDLEHEFEHEFEHEVDHDIDHDVDHDVEHEFEHEMGHEFEAEHEFDHEAGHHIGVQTLTRRAPISVLMGTTLLSFGGIGLAVFSTDWPIYVKLLADYFGVLVTLKGVNEIWKRLAYEVSYEIPTSEKLLGAEGEVIMTVDRYGGKIGVYVGEPLGHVYFSALPRNPDDTFAVGEKVVIVGWKGTIAIVDRPKRAES